MQQRIADKSIPISRNRLRFSRVWQRRERAVRCCVNVIISAVRSRNFSCTRPVSHKDRTRAEDAVRIRQTVRSGFSPPPFLRYFGQKQMAYGSDYSDDNGEIYSYEPRNDSVQVRFFHPQNIILPQKLGA